MLKIKYYNASVKPDSEIIAGLVKFLAEHLEQFGDHPEDILKAVNYAIKESVSFGGFLLLGYEEDELSGAVVVNKTGMEGYIPENILVYIATHADKRGRGIGKSLMKKTIELCKGNIALHVEPDNPARFLYENLGFTNKYLEMRLIRED